MTISLGQQNAVVPWVKKLLFNGVTISLCLFVWPETLQCLQSFSNAMQVVWHTVYCHSRYETMCQYFACLTGDPRQACPQA